MDRINKGYSHAGEINADIDNLQSNINTLISDMGLDPNNITFPAVDNAPGTAPISTSNTVDPDMSDFSFDQWLNEVTNAGVPDLVYPATPQNPCPSNEDFSFLNVPAYDSTPAPTAAAAGTAQIASPSGIKRKVDLVEIPEVPSDAPSAKKKR